MTEAAAKLGDLPTWDLADLYAGMDDPKLKADLEACAEAAKAFAAAYKGKLVGADAATVRTSIEDYERIDETLSRVMSYAGLLHAGDLSDAARGRFMQDMSEKATEISTHLVFYELELNELPEARMDALKADPAIGPYTVWLEQVSRWRAHQLSEDMETLLQEKSTTGRAAWNRLFDETMAELRFPIGGKEMPVSEALNQLSSTKRDERKAAGEAVGQVFAKNMRLFAQITNTLAKDKAVEDKWRKYPHPISARNLANQVEDEV
ncbi:MAG: oligoendopeptidase F, partial [Alphaproteobacteria bacterium]